MGKGYFDIIMSVKSGYLFLSKEWKYLAKIAWPALLVMMATNIFVSFKRMDASLFEMFLWELPSSVLIAWLVFQQSRLILIDERLGNLPENPLEYQERARSLIASISFYLLFAMFLVVFQFAGDQTFKGLDPNTENKIHPISLLLLGAGVFLLLWSIRLTLLPIVSSVRYPVKLYLEKVSGVMFSFRVFSLGVLASLPIMFIYLVILSSVIKTPESISFSEKVFSIILSAPMALGLVLVINASSTFALKQVLGKEK